MPLFVFSRCDERRVAYRPERLSQPSIWGDQRSVHPGKVGRVRWHRRLTHYRPEVYALTLTGGGTSEQ